MSPVRRTHAAGAFRQPHTGEIARHGLGALCGSRSEQITADEHVTCHRCRVLLTRWGIAALQKRSLAPRVLIPGGAAQFIDSGERYLAKGTMLVYVGDGVCAVLRVPGWLQYRAASGDWFFKPDAGATLRACSQCNGTGFEPEPGRHTTEPPAAPRPSPAPGRDATPAPQGPPLVEAECCTACGLLELYAERFACPGTPSGVHVFPSPRHDAGGATP